MISAGARVRKGDYTDAGGEDEVAVAFSIVARPVAKHQRAETGLGSICRYGPILSQNLLAFEIFGRTSCPLWKVNGREV